MEFPPDNDESQLPPPQPNTSYPPQQPDTSYPLPQPPYPYQPPPPVPPKKRDPLFWILLAVGIIIVIGVLGALLYTSHLSGSSTTLSEPDFKASTTDTTVATVDKFGASGQNVKVHFICTILGFVKDSSGNTTAANVEGPNALFGAIVQVAFPDGTELSQLNAGDTLEVWGNDDGVSSGQNAFGGTVQEVGVTALYMTDQTTGYSTK